MRRGVWLAAAIAALAAGLSPGAGQAAPQRADPGGGVAPPVIPLPRNRPPPDMQAPPQTPAQTPAPSGKLYVLETLQTAALAPELTQRLGPLNTLAEVESFLKQNRIPFTWRIVEAPASSMKAELVRQLDALPPREVFVLPQQGGMLMAVVLEVRPAPP